MEKAEAPKDVGRKEAMTLQYGAKKRQEGENRHEESCLHE